MCAAQSKFFNPSPCTEVQHLEHSQTYHLRKDETNTGPNNPSSFSTDATTKLHSAPQKAFTNSAESRPPNRPRNLQNEERGRRNVILPTTRGLALILNPYKTMTQNTMFNNQNRLPITSYYPTSSPSTEQCPAQSAEPWASTHCSSYVVPPPKAVPIATATSTRPGTQTPPT